MIMLQESTGQYLKPFLKFEEERICAEDRSAKSRKSFSAIVSYCCNIPESKAMLIVVHEAAGLYICTLYVYYLKNSKFLIP